MDYSDYVTVKFTRVKYMGEPTHWECDVYIKEDIDMGGGTAPTLGGVIDIAASIMYGDDDSPNEWAQFDANERNN